jgi:hypothetical protein
MSIRVPTEISFPDLQTAAFLLYSHLTFSLYATAFAFYYCTINE